MAEKTEEGGKKSVEELEAKLAETEGKLAQALEDNEKLDDKYRTLLGRLSSIKTTLGDRLKQDAEELEQCKIRLEEVEEQNKELVSENDSLRDEISAGRTKESNLEKELSKLRERMNVSQQNWVKEREESEALRKSLYNEIDGTRQSMQDWEVLAMEESSVRKALSDRCAELEEQLASQREMYEAVLAEKNKESSAVESLQNAIQHLQIERKKELKDVVESSNSQLEEVTKERDELRERATSAETKFKSANEELEKISKFESEVKEKNLLIGKLRHEAVILNEHLTKALKALKKGNPDDNVDRQLITNLLLSFLSLPRSDTKRYEVLNLISSFLKWNEEQRETAGLVRQAPVNTYRSGSVSGGPATNNGDSQSSESLGELWTAFLDQQVNSARKA